MVKIAVEEPFISVREALVKKGYKATMLDDKTNAMNYDCVVVRDKEDLADFHMNVPIVEAKGRTLFDIVEEVEERLVRSGKIAEPALAGKSGMSGGKFIAGAATGAVIGAAAGLLLTPKSGKEMQQTVKEKTSGSKEKLSGVTEQAKEKAGQMKEKSSGLAEKAKAPVDKLKAKQQDMKENKELKKQEKAIKKDAKAEEKAQKEHEKAEKQVEKEEKKAEKEAKKDSGGVKVVELGDASIENNNDGKVSVMPTDKEK